MSQPRPGFGSYIGEIACDFYVDDRETGWGDVLCVKFDEYDKYIGASYASGGLKVFNSFNGHLVSSLFSPKISHSEDQESDI